MKLIDNINSLLGDDISENLSSKAKLKISASFFSIYAYAALKKELEKIDELQFIFTSPTFVTKNVTDKLKKEKREFIIPKLDRENSLYGTEFEIHLKNKLTQKAIAKECANWIRNKVKFKSNHSSTSMQEYIGIQNKGKDIVYTPAPIQKIKKSHEIELLRKEIATLTSKLKREKQFNSKVEMSEQIYLLETRLKSLT